MKISKKLTTAVLAGILACGCGWGSWGNQQDNCWGPGRAQAAEQNASKEETSAAETVHEDLPADQYAAGRVINGEKTVLADSYAGLRTDESALLVKNGADVTLSHSALSKTGDTTDVMASKYNGLNAAVLAAGGSLTMDSCTVTTKGIGANALYATGKTGFLKVHNTNIRTSADSSRGIDATAGGKVEADNVNIGTTGIRSAAVATEPENASVQLSKSTINTAGEGSPLIYSKGDITVSEVKGKADKSEIAVVEGTNIIRLDYVDVSGNGTHGVMLYQNKPKVASDQVARLSVKNSALRSLKEGPLFFVTNTPGRIYTERTTLQYLGGELVQVATATYGESGKNGGDLTFMANQQSLHGNVTVDSLSSVVMDLQNGSSWSGAINTNHTARKADVKLDATSSWSLTSDSYINGLTDAVEGLTNIKGNGHTIYYDAKDANNAWLGGKTFDLQGGGQLKPLA